MSKAVAYVPPRLTRANRFSFTWRPPVEPAELGATAYHEAAHTVVALALGQGPAIATVARDGDTLGRVQRRAIRGVLVASTLESLPQRPELLRWAIANTLGEVSYAMAGPVAESLWCGGEDPIDGYSAAEIGWLGTDTDAGFAYAAATRLLGQTSHAEEFFEAACWRVERFLNVRAARLAVARVARLLVTRATIGENEIRSVGPVSPGGLHLTESEMAEWCERYHATREDDA